MSGEKCVTYIVSIIMFTFGLFVCFFFRVGVLISTMCNISREDGLLCQNETSADEQEKSFRFFLADLKTC